MTKKRGGGAGGSRKPPADEEVETLEFEGGSAIRVGRHIFMESHTDPEDFGRRLEALRVGVTELEAARESTRDRLDSVLADADPLEILAHASAVYLYKDPDTYRETDDTNFPTHIEFLALTALGAQANPPAVKVSDDVEETAGRNGTPSSATTTTAYTGGDADASTSENDAAAAVQESESETHHGGEPHWLSAAYETYATTNRAIGAVRELFEQSTDLLYMRSILKVNEPGVDVGFEDFRRETLLQSLNIRGAAYAEHIAAVLDGCLGPFDADCKTILGFTADEAWSLSEAVNVVIVERVEGRLATMFTNYASHEKTLKRLRLKRLLPKWMAALTPTQQKNWLKKRLQMEALKDALPLMTVTAADLSAQTHRGADHDESLDARVFPGHRRTVRVDEASADAWLQAFTCPSDAYNEMFHRQPAGGHPITQRPVLEVPNGYLVPVPTALWEALRPVMEDALREAGGRVWARYERHRAIWVERTATERIAGALPGAKSWVGVEWASDDDSSDLDGLVGVDDFGARIQAKAGRISPPARRGAPSMAEDVKTVINDAAHQHARLADALEAHTSAELGFNADQAAALEAPLSVEIVVCLDDVTVWATQTHKLRRLVALPDTPQVPWVLSLTDLMAVTDLLEGAQLVHYITRRLRLEAEQRVETHDELDWVGNYLAHGLFFDDIFERPDAPDVLRLTSFTGPIDTWYFSRAGVLRKPFPKPEQPMPDEIRQLLLALARDRPDHWLTASLLILNGDNEVRERLVDAMSHTTIRAREVGWSACTFVFADYSVTLMVDQLNSGRPLRRRMRQHWEEKVKQHGRPNAVAVGLGADGTLVVEFIENDPALTVGHVLLARGNPGEPEDLTDATRPNGTESPSTDLQR
ncbi:hypothetical protein [Nocardioides renjunii]|uniref:hypothetical protein n=1 Tax=Nocardioides renjunii TaxID=3095075 RepID=UPI002AFE8FD5|nr:hypothetical protein [Nocardioides sp. S-34]WQQ22403.1 hypothetical protein SHK17_00120 [Nocardioides sp. S-34]